MTYLSSFSALIDALGGPPALAKETGLPVSAVKMWKSRDTVPASRFAAVVTASRAAGLAGVTFEALHVLADRGADRRGSVQS
jgi:hypothetical protein